jgi:hypothetical protein
MIINYSSHSDIWEQKATIRTRPRRIVENDNKAFYPVHRQPLASHAIIKSYGKETVDYVLLQSLYKFINDVIIFETEIVDRLARTIAKGKFPFPFPVSCRYDAMSVVVDEDYHAYVAMDYLNQIVEMTNINPAYVCDKIELSHAIPFALEGLSEDLKSGMELICVAISENTLTSEVVAFARDESIKKSVQRLMDDHLADEGRHSGFWIKLVNIYWSNISDDDKKSLGANLPKFINRYLINEIQAEFDHAIIDSLDIKNEDKVIIKSDIVSSYPITNKHPLIGNIRKCLRLSGVLDHSYTLSLLKELIE